MEKFTFERNELVKVWVVRTITIKAENAEQARKQAEEQYPDDGPNGENVEWGSTEVLFETEEVLAVQVKSEDQFLEEVPTITF